METSGSVLKGVIQAISQYSLHKIERNAVYLERQLDVLIRKTSRGSSLKFFNPGEVLPAECLTSLVSLLADDATKHSLLLKCLLLFNNLVSDCAIRESLHEKFLLTPALARVVKYHGSANNGTLTQEALNLLQKVTYGHRVSFQEMYMEDLTRFLLGQICYPSTELTRASMGTLVNLTRDNFSVQSFIRNNENMKDFSRRLTKLLGDENPNEMLFSLILLVNLCLNDEIGGMFYNETNAPKTFQTIFNCLHDERSGETRRYAVDLFKDILKVERLQTYLANYKYLGACIEQTLNLLTSSSAESVIKIFEFLLTLSSVKTVRRVICKSLFATFPIQDESQFTTLAQTPLSRISDPLLSLIHWAGQSPDTSGLAPIGAYNLLIEVYEELVFTRDKIHHDKHAAAILPTALLTLKMTLEGDNSTINRKCQTMVQALKLLLTLCNDDNFLAIISVNIDQRLMSNILQYQFDNNIIAMKTSIKPPTDDWSGYSFESSRRDDSNEYPQHGVWLRNDDFRVVLPTLIWTSDNNIIAVKSSIKPLTDYYSAVGVDVVLHVLDLVSKLMNKEVEELFINTMQNSCIVPFLAFGLCSSQRERIQNTLVLVCLSSRLEAFPSIILGDALAIHNIEKEKVLSSMVPSNVPTPHHVGGKENFMPGVPHGGQRDSRSILGESNITNMSTQDHSSIQDLIKKMEGGLELEETKASEIISVYERSIQALQTKEQHLQDLLEAKTLALTQADRMLTQYRARKGQDEAECNRLRNLLIQSEKKNESFQQEVSKDKVIIEKCTKEIHDLHAENQKLSQIASMHQELTVVHSELTAKYESLQKAHQTTKQEHKSLSEMHEMLQKHNVNLKQQYDTCMEQLNTMQEERRKISTQLKTTETKLEDTKKASLKWEYDYKRSEEERETMEMSIEKLRNNIAKTEQKNKQMADQVSKLEFACNQNEAKITSYESQIQELKSEVGKQRQIQALINSLSSGNTDLSLPQGNNSNTE